MMAFKQTLQIAVIGLILTCSPLSAANLKDWLAAPAGKADVRIHDKFALLIGVNQFQDPAIGDNAAAENNVSSIKDVLTSAAGKFTEKHVQTLTGPEATVSGITDAVQNWLEKKALPDDILFVYVCSKLSADRDGHPLVYTYDTVPAKARTSTVDLHELLHQLKQRTQSKYIVCALDTSPALGSKGCDLLPLVQTGAVIFSATDGHEPSLNNGVTGTSVFVHHFCESINMDAGTTNLQNAFKHVCREVVSDAHNAFATSQSPLFAAPEGFPTTAVAIGAAPKTAVPLPPLAMGHPMDRLALEHPDLIPPRPQGGPTIYLADARKREQDKHEPASKTARQADTDEEDKPLPKVDFSAYIRNMRTAIQSHWTPPKTLNDKKIVATFAVYKDGHIDDPQIVKGSGDAEIDRSALSAIKAASPLAPLPAGSPDYVQMRFKFNWQVNSKSP